MAGPRVGSRVETSNTIRAVALDQFYRQGFQSTTLRHIAARVGIQVGSLYNHMASKSELLFDIIETVMNDLISEQARVAAEPQAARRLHDMICQLIRFRARRAKEVEVGYNEVRYLASSERSRIFALQQEHERLYRGALEDGIRQGTFLSDDPELTTKAILAVAASVARAASTGTRWTADGVGSRYADLLIRGIWNPRAGAYICAADRRAIATASSVAVSPDAIHE